MILSIIKVTVLPEKREEILEILLSVKGPTEVKSGCTQCHICQDLYNKNIINYSEVWENEETLYKHIRSDIYRSLLAVIDMSSKQPEIRFLTVSDTAGIELIKNALGYS